VKKRKKHRVREVKGQKMREEERDNVRTIETQTE
jgi:hypothetical protein